MESLRRRFSGSERAALYLASAGRCAGCGSSLEPGWHADHIAPHSRGGVTDVVNGQALCSEEQLERRLFLAQQWLQYGAVPGEPAQA